MNRRHWLMTTTALAASGMPALTRAQSPVLKLIVGFQIGRAHV